MEVPVTWSLAREMGGDVIYFEERSLDFPNRRESSVPGFFFLLYGRHSLLVCLDWASRLGKLSVAPPQVPTISFPALCQSRPRALGCRRRRRRDLFDALSTFSGVPPLGIWGAWGGSAICAPALVYSVRRGRASTRRGGGGGGGGSAIPTHKSGLDRHQQGSDPRLVSVNKLNAIRPISPSVVVDWHRA